MQIKQYLPLFKKNKVKSMLFLPCKNLLAPQ